MNTIDMLMPPEGESIITAKELNELYSLDQKAIDTVVKGKQNIGAIFTGKSDKFFIGVGNCASIFIQNKQGEYSISRFASEMASVQDEVEDVVDMGVRANTKKPRGELNKKKSYRGVAIDGPYKSYPNKNNNINENLKLIYKVYRDILSKTGIPFIQEGMYGEAALALSPLFSMQWLGARNCTSGVDRELLNILGQTDTPVGVKHTKDGNILDAAQAMASIKNGRGVSVLGGSLLGNPLSTLILRGTNDGPNYDSRSIQEAVDILKNHPTGPLNTKVIIDCNHANSRKDPYKQIDIALEVAKNPNVCGVLIEGDIYDGKCENGTWGRSGVDASLGLKKLIPGIRDIANVRRNLKKI